MGKSLVLIILFLLPEILIAQRQVISGKKITTPDIVCYGSGKTEKIYIPPPADFFLKSRPKKSDIRVTYSLFPDDAKAAFEFAVSIWEEIIESSVPIYVQANWRTQDNNTLGSSRPDEHVTNFENIPHKDRYYPIALAEKISKSEINPVGYPDIVATFNNSINWYFGTDGQTPGELYDFVTVVMHEIAHGLGITGFFDVSGKNGIYSYDNVGDASAFDIMVTNSRNQFLVDKSVFANPSQDLYSALTSGSLYSRSLSAMYDNNGNKPRLYAPSTWDGGSSIYHLNDATYPPSSGNSLMTHAIAPGEAVHNPGPLINGILADIGWQNVLMLLDKPKDIETKNPLVFNLKIESENNLDSSSLYLYYKYDTSLSKTDSLPMPFDKSNKAFSATLNPVIGQGEIFYYIKVVDEKNRIFSLPGDAPNEILSVKIGPDNEAPVIVHAPIPYFILTNENLKITASTDDNLGIDSVYVEYAINGIPQNSFELQKDSNTVYSGEFSLNLNDINDGDRITYNIVAIDSSVARNRTVLPTDSAYSFLVEKIFEPVNSYFNDFNTPTPDFLIYDFEIYTEAGFDNPSLQSPHPYLSPNKNNAEFNFTTILKRPVILSENATLNFDEIVLVEPGETLAKYGDDNFWDYVIVEGSKDNQKTWLPLADGYDSGAQTLWKNEYNKNIDNNDLSTTTPIPDWYFERTINMLENGNFSAGDTILIRFRLFSDPYARGWGWTIDNLRIQQTVSAPITAINPTNVLVYPNPFNDVLNITVNCNHPVDLLSYEIRNLQGQMMHSFQSKNNFGLINHEFDLSNLASGIYFISVSENGNPPYSRKIIKN